MQLFDLEPASSPDTLLADRYRIQRRLGTGGHAVVYFGVDTVQNLPVAVKELQFSDHHKADYREALIQRFYQEARIAGSLRHDNIIAVFDTLTLDNRHLMILEYVDGLTLDDYIESVSINCKQMLELLIQTADALGYAHRKQIVHRDIKPQNLLVTHAMQAKLMDFGIAKLSDQLSVTSDGSLLGTLAYMSPEQLQNSRNASALSDVYSFGVMMYEIFTGSLPFSHESLSELVTAVFCQIPPLVHEKNPRVPPALSAVIAQAMGREQSQRYQDMKQLRADLVRCLSLLPQEILMSPLKSLRQSALIENHIESSPAPEPRRAAKAKATPFYQKYLAPSLLQNLQTDESDSEDELSF